ncbi:MAG: CRISPR-associated endonuclease Cas1 [Blastocatellales bacterium]|nr:CRISPR-associated endonuclease Cas1 [Blastocatellales bacterium]
MTTLYITEQGSTLRREQNRLVVELDGRELVSIHDFKLERVIVFGNVQVTTQAMSLLLDRGIETAFLSQMGRLKGRLAPLLGKNLPLRLRQYERSQDDKFLDEVSGRMVAGKVANCREVLARQQRNHPEHGLGEEIAQLEALQNRLAITHAREALRGIEGNAAAVYYKGFSRLLRRGFEFTRRTRRPPTDPVNSLLSFGYTLVYNESIGALTAIGADPYLGVFHTVEYGRCSLALDLMEEFRPLTADRLALQAVNLEIVKAEDFTRDDRGGVTLSQDGRRRFLREYERIMTKQFVDRRTNVRASLRRALHAQAHVLQRTIMEGTAYQPFRGWH